MVKRNKDKSLSQIKFEKFLKNNSMVLMGVVVFVIVAFAMVVGSNGENSESLVYGDDVVEMYYFYLTTCPHCHEQAKFHDTLTELYPNLRIHKFEMTSSKSVEEYERLATEIGGVEVERWGTPTTFIGERSNVGFGTPETTGQTLIEMIDEEIERIESGWSAGMVRTSDLR